MKPEFPDQRLQIYAGKYTYGYQIQILIKSLTQMSQLYKNCNKQLLTANHHKMIWYDAVETQNEKVS